VEEKVGMFRRETYVYCGPIINSIELSQPQCRTAEECVKEILKRLQTRVGEEERTVPTAAAQPGGGDSEGVLGVRRIRRGGGEEYG